MRRDKNFEFISTSQEDLTGHFYLRHEKLYLYPVKFFSHYRMSKPSFEELLSKIEHGLLKRDTNIKKCNSTPQKYWL